MARQRAILVDMDGTLALRRNRGPFEFEKCVEDDLNVPVAKTVELFANNGFEVVICTGREEKYRPQTEAFLKRHLPWLDYELFCRQDRDKRSDDDVKEEIYRGKIEDRFEIFLCLDDRNRVVNRYRELGLTVFQVAPGDF